MLDIFKWALDVRLSWYKRRRADARRRDKRTSKQSNE